MVIWTLASKDLRLLLRDRRAVVILIVMPFVFILVLGLSLGEGFGQKPDNRLRVSVVDLDGGARNPADVHASPYGALPWSRVVQQDLSTTAGIRVESFNADLDRAERLLRDGKRAAVLVFGPRFSRRVARCSFLKSGINPFYRDGVKMRIREAGQPRQPDGPDDLDFELLIDPTQRTAASIIEQVAQVSLLRVVLPWMIGRAFEKIGDAQFIDMLATDRQLPGIIRFALGGLAPGQKQALGASLQTALQNLFPKYNLTAKTWASLTRSEPKAEGGEIQSYADEGGSGFLNRGAANYQRLVPSYTVMFAFFLVLTVGWLFVAERRQGTLKRLRAAPLSRTQILLGKLVPCFVVSLLQGLFLLGAGNLVFGMSWGPDPVWLVLVVVATSLAAMGLSLLVAALAQTETQVAIYGTLLVLVLAGVSGCLMGDRSLMPEAMQHLSLFTPHAWALVAYQQLLTNPTPNLVLVAQACGVLAAFGAGFVLLSWYFLKLD